MQLVRIAALLLSLSGAATLAQVPTVTAAVINAPLSVSVGSNFTQTHPVGPLTGANLSVTNGLGASASLVAGIQSGVNLGGLSLSAHGTSTTSAGCWVASEFVLTVTPPSTAPVRIVVDAVDTTPFGQPGSLWTAVDIDNDGGFDFSIFQNSTVRQEFTRLVGPAGIQVRLLHRWYGSTNGQNYSTDVSVTCYANEYGIRSVGQGCTNMSYSRPSPGALTFQCPAAPSSLVCFVVGSTAQNVTLPYAPHCPQFTDIVFATPRLPVTGMATYDFPPLPLLPHGFTVRTQAAVLTTSLDLLTTNCLVMTGP